MAFILTLGCGKPFPIDVIPEFGGERGENEYLLMKGQHFILILELQKRGSKLNTNKC